MHAYIVRLDDRIIGAYTLPYEALDHADLVVKSVRGRDAWHRSEGVRVWGLIVAWERRINIPRPHLLPAYLAGKVFAPFDMFHIATQHLSVEEERIEYE